MKLRRLALALLPLLASSGSAQLTRSPLPPQPRGTDVPPGPVSGTWTRAGSPYRVLGDIDVDTLVIQGGVEVRSAPGAVIKVQGSLESRGTAERPVLFTALDPAARWGRLWLFLTSGTSSLTHTRIERAGGGGLWIQNAVVKKLASCELVDNLGGGLNVSSAVGDLLIEDCLFEDNLVSRGNYASGGGIGVNMSGILALERCTVRRNRALAEPCGYAGGGGILVVKAGILFMTDCTVVDNECVAGTATLPVCGCRADSIGGGISLGCICSPMPDFEAILTRCVVLDNRAISMNNGVDCPTVTANAAGGGIYYVSNSQALTLDNCLVAGNSIWADGDVQAARGAGVFFRGSTLFATNTTVVRNTAIDGQSIPSPTGPLSAGVHVVAGTANVVNSILWDNRTCVAFGPPPAQPCAGSVFDDPLQGDAGQVVTYSDVEGGEPGTGNLDVPPLLAGPGTSFLELGLGPGSPCIDAGDPNPLYDDVAFPPSLGGPRNDMGHNGGPLAAGWAVQNP